jgi:hypothetical protein
MTYQKILVGDKLIFGVSDTEFIDIDGHEKFNYFCSLSESHKEDLIQDIKDGLMEAVEEELSCLDTGSQDHLTKTIAYVRLMQTVSSSIYINNETLAKEQEQALLQQSLIDQAENWSFSE